MENKKDKTFKENFVKLKEQIEQELELGKIKEIETFRGNKDV